MEKLIVFFLLLLLSGCGKTEFQGIPAESYVGFVEEFTRDLGIPSVETAPSKNAGREVRIWVRPALMRLQYFVRLISDGNKVSGDVILWWDNRDMPQVDLFRSAFYADNRCKKTTVGETYDFCHVPLRKSRNWQEVQAFFEDHSIWTLGAQKPRPWTAWDGVSLLVEARDSSGRHLYFFDNPVFSYDTQDANAASIIEYTQDLAPPVHFP
ncbi:MAG TPA: hypothetical protein VGH16_13720 [Candidatus Binatia bacterium]|jgi:hypothetical protein